MPKQVVRARSNEQSPASSIRVGMGMAVGGMYPHVAHGEALAILYPAFADFTWESAVPEFAHLAKILNPSLEGSAEHAAASKCPAEIVRFLERIGLKKNLKDVGMPETEIEALAKQCMVLPDYKGNPRVATYDEMVELVRLSFEN